MLFRFGSAANPRLDLLKHVILFKDLSTRELAMVDEMLHERRYLAGEVIFDEGEEGQGLFIVLQGRVKIARREQGNATLLEFGPGSFFGEVALLDQSVRTAQARALEDALIMVLFRIEFYALVQNHSAIASHVSFQLARILATRLRQTVLLADRHHEAT